MCLRRRRHVSVQTFHRAAGQGERSVHSLAVPRGLQKTRLERVRFSTRPVRDSLKRFALSYDIGRLLKIDIYGPRWTKWETMRYDTFIDTGG